MFTGIIEEMGRIREVAPADQGLRLVVEGRKVLEDARIGDSIAVSGVCLTVVSRTDDAFVVDVVGETLRRTTLSEAKPGMPVNLERALAVGDRLGGHLVAGHVDGMGTVRDRRPEGSSVIFEFEVPVPLRRYIAEKGSIAVDGVSLTVMEVTGDGFRVAVIPHTLENTTLGIKNPGDRVNLEVDIVARYMERLLGWKS
ncbi:MAG: riboflavin synthase [Alicyclobacillaceae bacterium]|nr:riboflavin synthase [Alicyclobacillaceae bacterium]